jgi:uncharacterized protein YbjT (DUF2867 family)
MIVVTTPTGAIGSKVVSNLLDRDAKVRVIVRDPDRLPGAVRDRVEVVAGTHGDPGVVTAAFAGAEAVFWLVPPDHRTESLDAAYRGFSRPAAEALVAQGVQRVVIVSATGRGTPYERKAGLVTASFDMVDLIAATGVNTRSLALPGFMDNVLRQRDAIVNEGVYRGTLAGDHRNPTCCTEDIAAAATRLLVDDTWTGNDEVPVLGPEDLSSNEMAAIMGDVLGRPVRYEEVPADVFRDGLTGLSQAMIDGFYDMMTAKRAGLDNHVPRTPESSSPTSFRQWCERVLKPSVA